MALPCAISKLGFRSLRQCSILLILGLAWVGGLAERALGQSCVSVKTYHNDNSRTGQNKLETVLTPASIQGSGFGTLFATGTSFDGWAVAQPLYLPDTLINIPQFLGDHNVVFVATLGNSIYAFDADSGTQLWKQNYGIPDTAPFNPNGPPGACKDSGFGGTGNPSHGAGIVGTPVIDTSMPTPVLYFVTKEVDSTGSQHFLRLRAVDTSTGTNLATATLAGSVVNHSGVTIPFQAQYQMTRPAMSFANGTIYIGIGSVGCKEVPNYGWVMSYTYNPTAKTFTQQGIFNTTPDLGKSDGGYANGGIWQGGEGLVVDSSGNVYFETSDANNKFNNQNWEGEDFGVSMVKLTSTLAPPSSSASYFTPWNDASLGINDQDLASVGPIALTTPSGTHPNVLIGSGKAQEIYVVDEANMGGYCSTCTTKNTNIVQDVLDPTSQGCNPPITFTQCLPQGNNLTCGFGAPAFWEGTSGAAQHLYFPGFPGPLLDYTVSNGTVSSCPQAYGPATTQSGSRFSYGSPSVSSSGSSNGLVWVFTHATGDGTKLQAFDPTTLKSLASETITEGVAPFATPTIANGTVYVGTRTQLIAYGISGQSGCKSSASTVLAKKRSIEVKDSLREKR
jgi:outer membrane protein assembly factor BamB